MDTLSVAPKEKFDLLNDIYAKERLTLAPRESDERAVSAGSRLWRIGELSFANTYSSGHLGRRIRSSGSPVLALRQHKHGGCHSWSEDGHFLTQPGDFIVTLNSVDGVHACHELETVNIALPVEILNFDWRSMKTTQILRAGSLGAKLLSVAIESWQKDIPHLSAAQAALLEMEIVSLVAHVLGTSIRSSDHDGSLQSLRGKAIRQHIDEHLASSTLNAAAICKTFALSRASLYREFQDEGGLRTYITQRRLQKAMLELTGGAKTRGRVADVALTVGYSDPAQFSRAFRSSFGFTPSEVMTIPLDTMSASLP